MRVQGVERVGADLTRPDLTQDRPDNAPDVALMGRQRGLSQVGDFEILVEDHAEGDVPVRHLVALRLPEHRAERGGGGCLVGAGLPEAALLAGDRIGPGVDPDAECAAGQPLDVAASGLGHDGTITR
jgi:hypothetical protein